MNSHFSKVEQVLRGALPRAGQAAWREGSPFPWPGPAGPPEACSTQTGVEGRPICPGFVTARTPLSFVPREDRAPRPSQAPLPGFWPPGGATRRPARRSSSGGGSDNGGPGVTGLLGQPARPHLGSWVPPNPRLGPRGTGGFSRIAEQSCKKKFPAHPPLPNQFKN